MLTRSDRPRRATALNANAHSVSDPDVDGQAIDRLILTAWGSPLGGGRLTYSSAIVYGVFAAETSQVARSASTWNPNRFLGKMFTPPDTPTAPRASAASVCPPRLVKFPSNSSGGE